MGAFRVCWQTLPSTITSQPHCDPFPFTSKRAREWACFIFHLHTQGTPAISIRHMSTRTSESCSLFYKSKVGCFFSKRLQREIKALLSVTITRYIKDSNSFFFFFFSFLRFSSLKNKHPYGGGRQWGVRAEELVKDVSKASLSLTSWVLLRFPFMKPF